MKPPPRVVLFRFIEEAIGVGGMTRGAAEHAQVENRELACEAEHLFFVDEVLFVSELLAQVAEHRCRLVADLA